MPDQPIITPTIGRRVWYWPSAYDRGETEHQMLHTRIQQDDQSQACDAGIAYVWNDRMVNLTVADHNGVMHSRCSVRLLQGDDVTYPGEAHATWMPYQRTQAQAPAAPVQDKSAVDRFESLAEFLSEALIDLEALRLDHIARAAHEVNRAYCQALGDQTQVAWEHASESQRVSARMGVDLHMMGNFGPEASHISWMAQKAEDGWTYGPVKSEELKQHPCMVPFDQLPREQQAKDFIFRAVVHAFAGNPA